MDTAGMAGVIDQVRAAGTFVTPNLSFVKQNRAWLDDAPSILEDEEYRYLPPYRRADWEQNEPGRRDNVAQFDLRERTKSRFLDLLTLRLHEAGVPLLAGTDASFAGLFAGASLHLELNELVRVGLTPEEALNTATSNPGRLSGLLGPDEPSFGVIQEGARADLVLLQQDPSEDLDALGTILGVVVNGRWIDTTRLDQMRPVWPRF